MTHIRPNAVVTTSNAGPKRWSALLISLGAGFIVLLDVSIVNVALPTISSHLHTSGSGLQFGRLRVRPGVWLESV